MPLIPIAGSSGFYSGDIRIDSLLEGAGWAPDWNLIKNSNTLKYSFNLSALDAFQYAGTGNTEFSNAQKIAVAQIFQKLSIITGIHFEQTDIGSEANFCFANQFDADQNSAGSAQSVRSQMKTLIHVNTNHILVDEQINLPSFNYEVIVHEIGHAMGLSHPFYNENPAFILNKLYDDTANTVMSYLHTGKTFQTNYQAFDILALQWMYGKDGLGGLDGFDSINGPSLPLNLQPMDTVAPKIVDASKNVIVSTQSQQVSFQANESIRVNGLFDLMRGNESVKSYQSDTDHSIFYGINPLPAPDNQIIRTSGSTVTFDISNLIYTYNRILDEGTIFNIQYALSSNTDASGNRVALGYISDLIGNRLETIVDSTYFSFKTGINLMKDGTKIITGNKLEGSLLSDTLLGAVGNDILIAHAGNNVVDGGADIDTVIFDHALADFAIQKVSTTAWKIDAKNKVDGTNAVNAVEIFKFADATMDLTVPTQLASMNPSTVHHLIELYAAFFNRIPDADGLLYWAKQIKSGTSMQQVTESFYTAGMHYATNNTTSSTTDFVHSIYQNVLGRADGGDSSGVAYWSKQLDQGTQTYGSLVSTMLDAAHSYKNGTSEFAWVANLLDNKISVGEEFAINLGVTYSTPELSIAHGVEIAKAITSTDTSAALKLIGVIDLPHV